MSPCQRGQKARLPLFSKGKSRPASGRPCPQKAARRAETGRRPASAHPSAGRYPVAPAAAGRRRGVRRATPAPAKCRGYRPSFAGQVAEKPQGEHRPLQLGQAAHGFAQGDAFHQLFFDALAQHILEGEALLPDVGVERKGPRPRLLADGDIGCRKPRRFAQVAQTDIPLVLALSRALAA